MFTLKRLIGSSLFVFVLASAALAQELRAPIENPREPISVPAAPLVTATATAKRVRFVSPGTVVQLRLEVYNETGQKLFDTEQRGGNVLDWHLENGAGERLPAGSYACVLTIKSLSGRLSQRVGLVTVNDKRAAVKAAGAGEFSVAQQQSIGPVLGLVEDNAAFKVLPQSEAEAITAVTHDGTDGHLTSTTGALTFRTGDLFSGKDVERVRITPEGNVGIGTAKPEAALDVAGDINARGIVRANKVEFADGTVQTSGQSGRKTADGTITSAAVGTGTQGRLARWIDNAGTLGNSIALDNGTGLQLTVPPSARVDTNIIYTNGNDRTMGLIASSSPSFTAANGPYFALRGNTYTAIAGQQGLFAISAGTVPNPTGRQGSIILNTGANQTRMLINPAGNVGIGTVAPTSPLTVTGNTTLPVVAATNNSASGGPGIKGVSNSGYGVRGEYSSGTTGAGVYGFTTVSDGNGIIAEANTGTEAFAIWGKSTNGEAGHFTGRVVVNGDLDILGTLSKDAGSFKIDHPLDPANKYLYHSFVESPDMMNIYNGNVTLDQRGGATVTMPQWFNALNKEFRYQLTAIGAPGPNLYISEEVNGNRFRIAGGTPGMKVSWQVTGIRKDVYAEAHRIPVEQDKPERERGSFLHPELHGQPKDKSLERARHPEKMRRAEENESQQPTNKQ